MNTVLFTLVIYAATNAFSHTDSVALTSVPNIKTLQECNINGRAAVAMAEGTYKTIKFICVPTVKD